jgi:hypothetical protein
MMGIMVSKDFRAQIGHILMKGSIMIVGWHPPPQKG